MGATKIHFSKQLDIGNVYNEKLFKYTQIHNIYASMKMCHTIIKN